MTDNRMGVLYQASCVKQVSVGESNTGQLLPVTV